MTAKNFRGSKSDYLHRLREKHELTNDQVSKLTRVADPTKWFFSEDAVNFREIPDNVLELLCIKLGEPAPFKD